MISDVVVIITALLVLKLIGRFDATQASWRAAQAPELALAEG